MCRKIKKDRAQKTGPGPDAAQTDQTPAVPGEDPPLPHIIIDIISNIQALFMVFPPSL